MHQAVPRQLASSSTRHQQSSAKTINYHAVLQSFHMTVSGRRSGKQGGSLDGEGVGRRPLSRKLESGPKPDSAPEKNPCHKNADKDSSSIRKNATKKTNKKVINSKRP